MNLLQRLSARRRKAMLSRTAAALMAAAVSAFSPAAAQADAGWSANDDDALLFDIRSGKFRLGDGVRGYQTDKGVCVDFADVVMALDLPVRIDKKSRRATGWIFNENQTITIDRAANSEQIMNKRGKLAPGAVYDTPEGWCVQVNTLARWLDVTLTPNMFDAVLRLDSERKLPFQRAMERRERAARIRPQRSFDLAKLPQSSEPYKAWRTPSVDAVVSVGGLRDSQSGQDFDVNYELFASGEVAGASFDARLASDDNGIPESLRVRAYRTDPKAGLLGPLGATHFALGDVTTHSTALVGQNIAGRGAYLTNLPVDRPENFDRTSFRGDLPAGWEAELYRNGQLLAFAEPRADGRYEFIDVPLLYGNNRFEVVLYGPQGQVRRDTRIIPVGLDSIPPRKTFYWAGIQQAGLDLINFKTGNPLRSGGWRGSFGLERGLDARTSLSGSLFSLRLDGNRHNYGELSLRRTIGPALIEVSGAKDFGGGEAVRAELLGQLGRTYISAESIWARGGFESDRILSDTKARHSVALDYNFKLGSRIVPFHIDAQYEQRDDGRDRLDVTGRLSANFRRFSLTGELNWERQYSPVGPAPPDEMTAGLLFNGRIGRVSLRGEARYRLSGAERGFESVNITGDWRGGDTVDWRGELGYDAALDRGRAAIGIVKRFDRFALTANVEGATDGSVAAGLNLAFSFGPDPRGGGLRVSRNKLAASGQALAVVFRDRNRDGIRQPDEPLESGVELTAGQAIAEQPTDENGMAVIENLQPFEPVLIGIDTGSLPDPLVQPALPGIVVTPRPGIAARIELPLVAAGEIEGTLVKPGGGILPGVELELVDAKNHVVKSTLTEFDGFFLFDGVPYGDYRLRIAELSAKAIRANMTLGITAQLAEGRAIARLGAVPVMQLGAAVRRENEPDEIMGK